MAELQASYIQASAHPADTDRLVLEGLMNPPGAPVSGAGHGVGSGATELQVTQNGTPNMSVNVAAGHVWIDGTEGAKQGTYHCYNDATKNLAIAASDPTNPRKDLVVAKVQDQAYSGGTNAWSLAIVTGTPAASPSEPAVPANAHVLAMISVAAGATSITNANITDRRRRAAALGGIVVCTSTTRPTTGLYEGLTAYETDTDKVITYNGSVWVEMVPAGAWSSYTPSDNAITVGNGTRSATYTRLGRTIHWRWQLILGTTSSIGADPRVGLPVPAVAGTRFVGSVNLLDGGVRNYSGHWLIHESDTARAFLNHTESGNSGTVNATNPFTWGSTDVIVASGTYEAAS